jgi:hypothetical protein
MSLTHGLILYALLIAAIAWIASRRGYCHKCHHHFNKCECCHHYVCTPVRWTEEGWVKVCKSCKEWIYLGDDFDNRPDEAPAYEPTRKD